MGHGPCTNSLGWARMHNQTLNFGLAPNNFGMVHLHSAPKPRNLAIILTSSVHSYAELILA